MGFKEQKDELRRKLRGEAPPTEQQSQAACSAVLQLPEYQAANTIFCFVGSGAEFDTRLILQHALDEGKRVAVPLCVGRNLMEARQIHSLKELTGVGSFGIPEPSGKAPLVRPEEIDFAVIPCLACDRRGFRLGHGGGFYDRYLEDAQFAMALLCRSDRVLDRLPADAWDVPVNLVVTDQEVIRRK